MVDSRVYSFVISLHAMYYLTTINSHLPPAELAFELVLMC